MFANVVRDAWRQYVRRPLAVPLVLAAPAATVLFGPVPAARTAVELVAVVAAFLLDLFLVAYLASALDPPPAGDLPGAVVAGGTRPAAAAWAATLRSILPGVRAALLEVAYVYVAIFVGMLLFNQDLEGSQADRTRLLTGTAPLIGFMLAFLAVLRQPIVLEGQRRVLHAAALSHRVATRWFPICLVIGLMAAAQLVVNDRSLSVVQEVAVALVTALVQPFLVGVANALYLHVRAEVRMPERR